MWYGHPQPVTGKMPVPQVLLTGKMPVPQVLPLKWKHYTMSKIKLIMQKPGFFTKNSHST
jgi:hypothetical protein